MKRRKTTFFFDLGGVLLYFSHELMCQQIASFCHLSIEEVKHILLAKEISSKYELGYLTSQQLHQLFCHMTQKNLDFYGLMHATASIFSPNMDILPVLYSLKKRGIKLFILSNTCEFHFHYAKKNYRFLELFDGYILSYEIKMRKPDKEIFLHALQMAKTAPQECFYIDDLLENVESAKQLGIESHQFISTEKLISTFIDLGISL